MKKTQFVQTAVITLIGHPSVMQVERERRIDTAINLAEALWRRLDERGYGGSVEADPKETRNWYAELQDQERFDKIWRKYGKTGSRNEAAKAWLKVEESAKDQIEQAVPRYLEQIAKEGVTKAHFATWLNGRRWESFDAEQPSQAKAAINQRAQDIAAMQKMVANARDDATRAMLQAQLDRLTE